MFHGYTKSFDNKSFADKVFDSKRFGPAASGAYSGPTYQATGAVVRRGATGGDLTPAWPAHAAGDWGFLVIACTYLASRGGGNTLEESVGFALVGFVEASFSGIYVGLTVYKCLATSSAMASPVVTSEDNVNSEAWICTVRGADAVAPVYSEGTIDTAVCDAASGNPGTLPVSNTVHQGSTGPMLQLVLMGAFHGGASGGTVDNFAVSANARTVTERLDNSGLGGGDYIHAFVGTAEIWDGQSEGPTPGDIITATYANTVYSIWSQMVLEVIP